MKSQKFTAGIFLFAAALSFSRCTKEQVESYDSSTKEIITTGTWSVDYFYDGADKTAYYSSYQLNFSGNGTVNGSNSSGTTVFTGNWMPIKDVRGNDVIRIEITTQDPSISELNEHWSVLQKNKVTIEMTEGTSQLRLKKI